MAINFKPRVGQVLECNFGNYRQDPAGGVVKNDFNAHIPPEMVKNRLVVVLNGRIPGACLVVPLSTTLDIDKVTKGWQVELSKDAIPDLLYFSQQKRWAKCDMVEQVSVQRLGRTRETRGHIEVYLDRAAVEAIQRAVVKVIGGASLLAPQPKAETEAAPAAPVVETPSGA